MTVYGEWTMAEKALKCLPEATEGLQGGYRVILVDNGTPEWENKEGEVLSPAEQAAGIKELMRPQDQFVRLEENLGYPGGMNHAVSKGRSPLILILTSDVYMEPGSITQLVKEMDNPEVGIVGPLLLFPLDESPHGPPGSVQSAGMSFNIRGEPFHIFIGWSPENSRVKKRREMQALTGACLITRRALFDAVGGFRADLYGAGTFEDMDLCFSIRSLGTRAIFTPEAVGYHFVGGSIIHGAQRGGFPLTVNGTVFRGRWATALAWDEYQFY
jgi:GT2 family glycosyltransferase